MTLCSTHLWIRRILAIVLIVSLGPTAPLFAQVSSISGAQAGTPMALHIVILEGEDSLNNIRERTAREPIVQVEDENHKPVAGALLLFTVQGGPSGAGASFNGLSTLSVTTDSAGRATAHGLKPNQIQGQYSITVQATLGSLVATSVIAQSNIVGGGGGASPSPAQQPVPETPANPPGATPNPTAPSPESPSSPISPTRPRRPLKITHFLRRPWVVASGVVIVGVVVGVAVATSNGGSKTTITPGTGTVGP